jgi:hypothetical protein
MNKQFLARLKREAKKSPKKALLLTLLFLTAMYFWAPLLKGWFGKESTPEVAATPAAPQTALAPGSTAAAPGAAEAKKTYPWSVLASAIDGDPQMAASDAAFAAHDPFEVVEKVKVVVDQPLPVAVVEAEPALPLTPSEAGLALSSTLVGSRKRMAIINGKAYSIGDRVTAGSEGSDVVFVLAEVHPRRAVLARDGERYEIKLKRLQWEEMPSDDAADATPETSPVKTPQLLSQ